MQDSTDSQPRDPCGKRCNQSILICDKSWQCKVSAHHSLVDLTCHQVNLHPVRFASSDYSSQRVEVRLNTRSLLLAFGSDNDEWCYRPCHLWYREVETRASAHLCPPTIIWKIHRIQEPLPLPFCGRRRCLWAIWKLAWTGLLHSIKSWSTVSVCQTYILGSICQGKSSF